MLQGREARSDLELAADGLDVVAVGIEQERGVVAARLVRAVLLADTGRAVVSVSRLDTGSVERVHLLARVRDEGHVDGAARVLVAPDHEVRELGTPVALPERRYREWFEDRLVERDARARDPALTILTWSKTTRVQSHSLIGRKYQRIA